MQIRSAYLTALFALLTAGALPASAPSLEIEWVKIGDPDNAPDAFGERTVGSVPYEYEIGRYEVTNQQYAAFLNAVASVSDVHGLYHPKMGDSEVGGILRTGADGSYRYEIKPGWEAKPVNYVSLADAARFANWLTSGGSEEGSYDLKASQSAARFARTAPLSGAAVQYFVASEDEWYKAAYYDPSREGGAGGYWSYATRSDTKPTRLAPYGESNRANYGKYEDAPIAVGTYMNSPSYYGTFDQEGNVAELTDTLAGAKNASRIRRGSHYANYLIGREHRAQDLCEVEAAVIGFRIVALRVTP